MTLEVAIDPTEYLLPEISYKPEPEDVTDYTPYDIYTSFTVKDSVPAEHIFDISEALMDTLFDDDKPNRLTVSQPPRTAKSSLITLSFPFWLILMDPELNILIVNYSQGLADDFGIILRQLFIDNADLLAYHDIYLSDKEHSRTKFRFENSKGELLGSVKLTGVGGPITGRDVDICICDDLIKGFSDCTPTLLDKLYEWYKNILIPRLEPHSKLFMLGTRWHTQDVIGRLMEEQPDKYQFITLKALKDDGSCIWNNRYTPDFFEERRKEVGDRVFEAQYQGQPLDETGDYFNIDNILYSDPYDAMTSHVIGKCRSWDLAYTSEDANKSSDYTAGAYVYKNYKGEYILSDLVYGRFGEDNINKIKGTSRRDKPETPILIETGTVGAAAGELYKVYSKKLQGYNVRQSLPIGSKIDRAFKLQQAILDGKFGITIENDNLREIILNQLKAFPYGKNDDIVDSISYAIEYLEPISLQSSIGVSGKNNRRRFRR